MNPLNDLFHHAVTDYLGFRESGFEEFLRGHEPLLVRLEMPDIDTLGPGPRGKGELQIVAPVGQIGDGRLQGLLEDLLGREEVLGDTEAEAEERGAADHVVVGDDAEDGPAVDHGQQGEVAVGARGGRVCGVAEGEGGEDRGLDEGLLAPALGEDLGPGGEEAGAEGGEVALEHELVEVGDAAGVLGDLLPGLGVEDGEAGVDVPLLAVDAEHGVDLDVLDAADVAAELPGELGVCVPGLAHAEEGGVGDGLGVGGDAVVLQGREVDEARAEAGEHRLDPAKGRVRGPVLDQHQGLVERVDGRAVQGVDGDDVDVQGEVGLEGLDLRVLAGRLAAGDGSEFGR